MRSCNAGRRRSRRVAAAQTFGSLLSTSPFELYNRHKAEARQKQLPLILYARGDRPVGPSRRPVPSAYPVGLSRGPTPAMRFDGIKCVPLSARSTLGGHEFSIPYEAWFAKSAGQQRTNAVAATTTVKQSKRNAVASHQWPIGARSV